MNHQEVTAAIQPLISKFKIPDNRRVRGVYYERKKFKDGHRYAVGYSWTRPYSHFMKGLVYDTALAFGPTLEAAIDNLKKKAADGRP